MEWRMTQDEIIEMARQAGLAYGSDTNVLGSVERFANLVAQHEREACAKIADNHIDGTPEWNSAANNIAQAIRARGQA
jgi:hypothetical protein